MSHQRRVFINHPKGTIVFPVGEPGPLVEGEVRYDGVKFAFAGPGGDPAEVAVGFLRKSVLLSFGVDDVPGQAATFYIDKGSTSHGHNVVFGSDGSALFRLLVNGVEQLVGADFIIVASESTGPEGPAAPGSKNAIKFLIPIPPGGVWTVWYDYQRLGEASP